MGNIEVSQSVLDRFKKVGTPTVFTMLMNMGYFSQPRDKNTGSRKAREDRTTEGATDRIRNKLKRKK